MKHLKIYEQFIDMEDLLDEEIFGEIQKDLIIGKRSGSFYILYDSPNSEIDMYDDDESNIKCKLKFSKEFFNYGGFIPSDKVCIHYANGGSILSTTWGKLKPSIKDRINLK